MNINNNYECLCLDFESLLNTSAGCDDNPSKGPQTAILLVIFLFTAMTCIDDCITRLFCSFVEDWDQVFRGSAETIEQIDGSAGLIGSSPVNSTAIVCVNDCKPIIHLIEVIICISKYILFQLWKHVRCYLYQLKVCFHTIAVDFLEFCDNFVKHGLHLVTHYNICN